MTDKNYPTISEIHNVSDLPLIVTHSAPVTRVTVEVEKTCRTCGEWVHCYGKMGECLLPWDLKSQVQIDMNGDSTATLMTPDDFGCNQWQPRPDADARE